MRYYIDLMDHELGDDGKRARTETLEECAVMTAPILKALHEVTAERDALREKMRSSITSYAQIEAIHEAMREAEAMFNDINVDYEDDSDAAKFAFAKIRAALAGEKASDDGSP